MITQSTGLVVTSPEQFVQEGLSLVDQPTLLDDPLFDYWTRRIDGLVAGNPLLQARPPRPYQKRYTALSCTRNESILAWEQGTGKSLCISLVIHLLYGQALDTLRPGSIQILAPKLARNLVWLKKELKLTGLDRYAAVIEGDTGLERSTKPIWIYHYDLLNKKSGNKRFVDRVVRKFQPKLLVVDELHRLRLDTSRTEAVTQLRQKAKRFIGLTGTPMDGWVAHLASILEVAYKPHSLSFPFDAHSFKSRFTRREVSTADYVTGSATGKAARKRLAPGIAIEQLPAFHANTRHLIHRLVFADPEVSPHVHFPKMDHQIVELPLDTEHQAFYDRVHRSVIQEIQDAIRNMDAGKISKNLARQNVLTHLNLLRAAADHPWAVTGFPGGPTSTSKLDKIEELVRQYAAEGRKVLIFTNRIPMGREIHRRLNAAGLKTLRLYSEDQEVRPKKLTDAMRDAVIEQFQEDESVVCLTGNLDLMAEALTLIEASVVIHADHDWRSVPWLQGNNRVVRPGQEYDPVPVYDLVPKGTVGWYVYKAMQRKVVATKQVLDKEFDVADTGQVDHLEVARALIAA